MNSHYIMEQQICKSDVWRNPSHRIKQEIDYFNSLGDWIGKEVWLASAVEKLHKQYEELRNDIREKSDTWSFSQYCEQVAFHYYKLACYFSKELFQNHNINLGCVKQYLEKSMHKLSEGSSENLSIEAKQLKIDAGKFLTEVTQKYDEQRKQTTENEISIHIALGSINRLDLQQLRVEDRQKIQNIQLLCVIDILENSITLSEFKNTVMTVEHTDFLSQAYQLAGQSALSSMYSVKTENMFKTLFDSEEQDIEMDMSEIEDIVGEDIEKHKKTLKQVEDHLEKIVGKSLSETDKSQISSKYMEISEKVWLKDTIDLLKKLISNKNHSVILAIFDNLDNIKGLNQIPSPLNQLTTYQLLMQHQRLISEKKENNLVNQFKIECLEQKVQYIDFAGKEFVFLDKFVDYLSLTKNLQSIIAETKLGEFCHNNLSFKELLNGILRLDTNTYGEGLKSLQNAAKYLQQEESFILVDKCKEILGVFIKPIDIQARNVDGRFVVEVIGKNIVLSEILRQLEDTLSRNPTVEEIRFVGAAILHIDSNLENEIWHGKNMVVLTKNLKIYGIINWNLSGKDNKQFYTLNAGTEEDGQGREGKDGYAGESGGNALILAEKIENHEHFTIISNGGKGGKGQDGGNGIDGKDGVGITREEFENFEGGFESKKNIEILKKYSSHWDILWFKGSSVDKVHAGFYGQYNYFYMQTKTESGNEIVYSFYGPHWHQTQSYLLFKGSLGLPGCHGGKYGFGGQGGYPGDIIMKSLAKTSNEFEIVQTGKQGNNGDNGIGGRYGAHGKNGWDMGFTDFINNFYTRDKWPRKFGTDQKSKCTFVFNDDKDRFRVWCGYKKKYVDIAASRLEHSTQEKYEERKSTRLNRSRQHHAQAARKKNISQNAILANYSHHLGAVEMNVLQKLRSDLETAKQQALQEISQYQIQKQQEKLTLELAIKRQVHFYGEKKIERNNDLTCKTNIEKPAKQKVNVLYDAKQLEHVPKKLKIWFLLKGMELTQYDFNELFSEFEGLKNQVYGALDHGSDEEIKIKVIEELLIDKYKLFTLQEIAKQVPHYPEVSANIEMLPENLTKYLIANEENESIESHPVLGVLNQYIFQAKELQRDNFFKYYDEQLPNNEDRYKILKLPLKMFITEMGESEEVHPSIKKYYDEQKEFLDNQEKKLLIFYEAFKSEMTRPRHAELKKLWIESMEDQALAKELEKEIQKDDFLKELYDRFNNELKQEYDWQSCCNDQTILTEYKKYIQDKWDDSESLKELLANIYNINLRVYSENQNYLLILQGNYNTESNNIIHILNRNKKIFKLKVDENHLKLHRERAKRNDLFLKIFVEISSFKTNEDFDNYLKSKAYFATHSTLENLRSFDEEADIVKIIEYFPDDERPILKKWLEKITSQYIGHNNILLNLLTRISCDGKWVTSQILNYLINSILASVVMDKDELNIFSWIIAAFPQENWMDELILLQLEDYFKMQLIQKPQWRHYLSKIENKDVLLLFLDKLQQYSSGTPISVDVIETILNLLSKMSKHTINLEGLELSEWHYALIEKYWTFRLSGMVKQDDLPTVTYLILSMMNIFGNNLVEQLIEALDQRKKELSSGMLINILSNFHSATWNLSEKEIQLLSNHTIIEWNEKMKQIFAADGKDRDIAKLVELIQGNTNTSKEISDNLPIIKSLIEKIPEYTFNEKPVNKFTEDDIKIWVEKFRRLPCEHFEVLSVIIRAIHLKQKIILRDTQKFTILTLLTNKRNTLAQVSTGEGKSLIVVAASIMKAISGQKVHIITSSSVLATRDAEEFKEIYNMFDIRVSHNCGEDIEKRKEAYSGNQVIYGDLSNFQRDYLLDKFYAKNILGDHTFDNVIVDEVDSMLLDKGNNMLYLSHDLADLDKLESVYIYIWQWINRPAMTFEEISYAFDIRAIKEAVMSDLDRSLVKRGDIAQLGSDLSDFHKNDIWDRLIEAEILDEQGVLFKQNLNKLDDVLKPEVRAYKDRLVYLLTHCAERRQYICVPQHLRQFIKLHLDSWIDSAIKAFWMEAGENYVVDVDRTGMSQDCNPNIIILDKDTGTDQANSQWDAGLHQFLQLKHGCKLSLQSLKAVFISNVSYFKLYRHLYGLTGTLGLQRERHLLQEIHKVDFVTIPTFRPKRFNEYKPILCSTKEEWIDKIRGETEKLTKERSILIICETVNDVKTLYNQAFGGKEAKNVHTYTRDYEEFDKGFENMQGSRKLGKGQIIIATNLAGRGTNIKISRELNESGGLHVCLSYLPTNSRIEQQAFGRAARSGDEGSGQLIFMDPVGQAYSNFKALDLTNERNSAEFRRISDIKVHYETQISKEEKCFRIFQTRYEKLKKGLEAHNAPPVVREILLQSCIDKWAFWLDEYGANLKKVTNALDLRNFYRQLDKFIEGFDKLEITTDATSWMAWVRGNPAQMIKLGKYLASDKEHDNAIKLFDEVIDKEPRFSHAAHYYKAFALTKKINWEKKPLMLEDEQNLRMFKKELQEAAKLFDEHMKTAYNAAGLIDTIKAPNNDSIIKVKGYTEQKMSLINLYQMFSQSIDAILGTFININSFVQQNITEESARDLYAYLIKEGVLKSPSLKQNISKDELKTVINVQSLNEDLKTAGNLISVEALKTFLSEYEGKEINEEDFGKAFAKAIPLPNREEFWDLLVQEKFLSEEVEYVGLEIERLKSIDPSFLDFLSEKVEKNYLKNQTFDLHKKDYIFLYAEGMSEKSKTVYVFKKDEFIMCVGQNIFLNLKSKDLLSFNKTASFDLSKIESTNMAAYASITLDDFDKVDITKTEAEKILGELLEKNIIAVIDGTKSFRLNVKFDELNQVELSSCPLYENIVIGLLSQCFSYRIALEKISKQIKEEDFPIMIHLHNKPHNKIIFKLFEQNIISSAAVTNVHEDYEPILTKKYRPELTKDKIKLMFSQFTLGLICSEKLINALIFKKWVTSGCFVINNLDISMILKKWVISEDECLVINSADKRQKLNFFYNGILINIDKTVEYVLDNQLKLQKKSTINHIVDTLKRLRGSLYTLDVPDSKLESFTNQAEFGNIDEVQALSLNGLDQLIQLEEKRWTLKMILSTIAVIGMGIVEIAAGIAIELYSLGSMTHVGGALINEGISDLIYGISALSTGYFSWKDYGWHKLKSLALSAFSVGIGAWLSRAAKVSRFGSKVADSSFKIEENVAKMTGKQLIKNTWKILVTPVSKRFMYKALEGVAFGLASVGIDTLIENYLQVFCQDIASFVLSDIERTIREQKISTSIKEAYEKLGAEKARQMIKDLTDNVLSNINYYSELVSKFGEIAGSITEGISEGMKKIGKLKTLSMTSNVFLSFLSKVVVWTERSAHLIHIKLMTANLLDDIDRGIKTELKNVRQNINKDNDKKQNVEISFEQFERELKDNWKLLLCDKAREMVQENIVGPILKQNTNRLLGHIGKNIQSGYQTFKEHGLNRKFKKEKQKNQKLEQNKSTPAAIHAREAYHNLVIELMKKTKNPKLFAALVRENVPMDMTCVSSATYVIHKALEKHGITGITIIVEGEKGIKQTFSQGVGGITINLELKDNHFQLHGNNNASEDHENKVPKNNCLFEAISKQINLGLTPDEFRAYIANHIENDSTTQNHIRNGLHQLPLSHGAFGGLLKKKNSEKQTVQNQHPLNQEAEALVPYQHKPKVKIQTGKKGKQTVSTEGGWEFRDAFDKDLRKTPDDIELTNDVAHVQLARALNLALEMINANLPKGKKEKPLLEIENFEASLYDIVITKSGSWMKFPVEMKAVYKLDEEITYPVKIDIDNPDVTKGPHGPRGPHVGYQIKSKETKITGHILLDRFDDFPGRGLHTIDLNIDVIPPKKLFSPLENPDYLIKRKIFETNKNTYQE